VPTLPIGAEGSSVKGGRPSGMITEISPDGTERFRQNDHIFNNIAEEWRNFAGKKAILNELAKIAEKATPDDAFFMSFSGHGYSAALGEFYLMPSDITGHCKKPDDTLLNSAISTDELAQWLRSIDAGEMTLILDACDSAESIAGDFKPGPMGSRGFGQLTYDKRMRILAASQSNQKAYELSTLKEGLLTYSLTEDGLKQGKADWKPVDHKITVGEWLGYAVKAVPQLSKSIDAQQPVLFDFSKTDTLSLQ
jgi:hypothetical protein